jgi:hypothetical protein
MKPAYESMCLFRLFIRKDISLTLFLLLLLLQIMYYKKSCFVAQLI